MKKHASYSRKEAFPSCLFFYFSKTNRESTHAEWETRI